MKLTVDKNRETIKRYRHIKPAPKMGAVRCAVLCVGTSRHCTREKGHSGPHVAHGMFRRVVAVWDSGISIQQPEQKAKRAVRVIARDDLRERGLMAALVAFRGRVMSKPEKAVEQGLLLLFALAMAGFVLDWALRILGGG